MTRFKMFYGFRVGMKDVYDEILRLLGDIKENNKLVIVEGVNDRKSLASFGIKRVKVLSRRALYKVVEEVKEHKGAYGYNVEKREYEDLVAAGVLDPAKVVRCALQNAASIAGLMLTTECMVTELPEKEKKPLPGASGYEGGMDEDY